ncbi:MAG: ABC transporter permease [Lysinibacillus sp.]
MSLSKLVFRSMKKNMKHYYLYFFALIFSVTLFFSFVTLQFNDEVLAAVALRRTATAGFEAATYILYFIILFFVLYANHLFMKRRSKEIGLYQLIGMTKSLIVRLLAFENILLFLGAIVTGIVVGFFSSRLFAMILLRVLEKEALVKMTFSTEALQQSIIVFAILLVIVLIQMTWMIYRVSLLSLFTASKQADERVKQFSSLQMGIGFLGLILVVYGYYISTKLFDIEAADHLFLNIIIILVSTIGGTFLVFRFSVAFLLNIVRLKKNGHLSGNDVLALTPIMHRMKSNAKSLTLITVLTGVSLGITTLSYIAYYSSGSKAYDEVPGDYIFLDDYGQKFLKELEVNQIDFEVRIFPMQLVSTVIGTLLPENQTGTPFHNMQVDIYAIPLSAYQQRTPNASLKDNDVIIVNYNGQMAEKFPLEKSRDLPIKVGEQEETFHVVDIRDDVILGRNQKATFVVSDEMFAKLVALLQPYDTWSKETAVVIKDKADLARADKLYLKTEAGNMYPDVADSESLPSYEAVRKIHIEDFGITIFTTAFLGLAFLMTTGSILYFKQMSEAEEERASYTVLRKIGFSERHIMKGVYMKQLFNFGVPLFIGLLHSYFAVKSGWFLFGTELTAPLWIAMGCYVALYAIFALLSVGYYKKVVRESL